MPWPQTIILCDSEFSHAYDGSEVRETWYIEPYDAADAFISSCLGRYDDPAIGDDKRTLPAQHFRYKWCLAVQADCVPLDKRQFSYMGPAALQPPIPANVTLPNQIIRVKNALQTYGAAGSRALAGALRPNADNNFVSIANQNFSAGAFVNVTYQPILLPTAPSGVLPTSIMDFVNYRYQEEFRKNVPNSGLRLRVPNGINAFYPSAGIAPEFSEEYLRLVVERRMLSPAFDLSALSKYANCVDKTGRNLLPQGIAKVNFQAETIRFRGYGTEFVQVPTVDQTGEPNGYSRWLNLRLEWDWRQQWSTTIYDWNGGPLGNAPITWNHVLAYPGTIWNLLAGTNLAWWKCGFGTGLNQIIGGTDQTAFPLVQDSVGAGASILDPLTINP